MLAYSDEGAGRAIVFVHGIGGDRTRWLPVTGRLTDSHRCVRVDLPGHGDSPPDGCDALSAAGAVQQVIESLSLRRPIVVGHSLGGNVVLLHGALHRPAGVVAVDPVPLFLPHLADSVAPYLARLRSDEFHEAFAEWEAARFPVRHLPAAQRAEIRKAHVGASREVVLSYWANIVSREAAEGMQDRFAAALAAITAPTLVCVAETPTAEDRAVLDGMPAATVEVWEGAGHYLHLADPDRFADRVRTFAASLG